jgi:hypothetical protein
MIFQVEDTNQFEGVIQFGSRRGQQAISALLMKFLSHNRIVVKKLNASGFNCDICACFDNLHRR